MGCVVTTSVLEVSMMAEICNGINATWAKPNMERRRSQRRFKKLELADKVNGTVKFTLASKKENLPSQLVRQAAFAAADG